MKRLLGWMLLLLISAVECSSNSPPGKPVFQQCHSPDKETFTCRWEPDADDGEDTIYRLFYRKDQSEIQECPDYRTAGKNSCFFNKVHTSIWVDYFLTVTAFNPFGNTSSDVYKIDVENIVKASPPENVTLRLELDKDSPTIHVTWNPYNSGSNYGWVTAKYQLGIKKEDTGWIMDVGTQTRFSLYSVSPGEQYMVQVRCALDNGLWSEWSNATYLQVPKSISKQQQFWILVSFFSAILVFTAFCILFIKRKFIKQWLLPPVPGPKIKGVDVQLLKNGRSEEVTSALLINQIFPQMTPWKNQVEEYLVVCDDNLMLVEEIKSRNGMVISNKLSTEANINNKESIVQNNVPHKQEVQTLDYFVDTSEAGFNNGLNIVNTMETEKAQSINDLNAMPLDSCFVGIHKQDMCFVDYSTVRDIKGEHIIIMEKQNRSSDSKITDMNRQGEENLPEDYTRVKEVKSDHMVLLQDPSCRNNMDYTDCGKSPHSVMDKGGVCAQFLRNGYVDNICTPSYCEL